MKIARPYSWVPKQAHGQLLHKPFRSEPQIRLLGRNSDEKPLAPHHTDFRQVDFLHNIV